LNPSFDLKQPVAKAMASGHTHEVRPESGTIQSIIFCIQGIEDMRQIRTAILTIFHKNHIVFSLHCQTAIDINPIVKTIVTGPDQRHCSTTFYQ